MTHYCYDVIVVGAGHAGVEAALAAARMGAKTAVFVIKLESIGRMSCNPSIGGPAKGHLAREIDALGGEMGYVADLSAIHYRMLNKSKGPAVWAPRTQNDRQLYSLLMREILENQPNLQIIETEISGIISDGKQVKGIRSAIGREYFAPRVILATGTFLNGLIHIGDIHYTGGRSGEPAALALTDSLLKLGLNVRRFKTGTPPRVDMRTLKMNLLEEQPGDEPPEGFSLYRDVKLTNFISCYMTRTSPGTHEIIRENLHRSALYGGHIQGTGPRYCPSIEDKIVKFPDKEAHHIFIEPEGLKTHEAYVNGVSNSLPPDVQERMIHSIIGLEDAVIMRYGYAIEYDYVNPGEMLSTLETKKVQGLYLAGQINGTSGYEEAAAQGLMAGINAVLSLQGKDALVLSRSDAYLGVLIDDLVTKGTNEPYRMFTSRAEYRLWLRQDNADERLMPLGWKLGLVTSARWQRFQTMLEIKQREMQRLQTQSCRKHPDLNEQVKYAALLKRPEIGYKDIASFGYSIPSDMTDEISRKLELEIKYEGYLQRQDVELLRFHSTEQMIIPEDIDYFQIESMAWEAREKLAKVRPRNIGQAIRIPGVNYTDASALLLWIKKHKQVDKDRE